MSKEIMLDRYKSDGIWTMETPRTTCVVPAEPLVICPEEEGDLNELCLGVYRSLGKLCEYADYDPKDWRWLAEPSTRFPQGLTLPPAIRIDTVRTKDGPKVVEVDPISAISLGETTSLIEAWRDAGYNVPTGLCDSIALVALQKGLPLSAKLPIGMSKYQTEVDYLLKKLSSCGVSISDKIEGSVQLSAFMENGPSRRQVLRGDAGFGSTNPLWGSLFGAAAKDRLLCLLAGDNSSSLANYLLPQYTANDLEELNPDKLIVAKPVRGMGSRGVYLATVKNTLELGDNLKDYVFQEFVKPRPDYFGGADPYVSRVSLYAGEKGLLGAQVTARPETEKFTNAHGQADAIQTTLAVSG